jgi:DNA invertase Pin-like site-specific DNA recombinase
MKIGYAGAAAENDDIGDNVQLFELKAAGCVRYYRERFTGRGSNRPRLRVMLENLRSGDTVVVTKFERLAHSTPDLFATVARIKAKGAGLLVLDLARIDARGAAHDLIPAVLETIAAFDRRTSLEPEVKPALRPKPRAERAVPFRPADSAEVRRLRSQGKSPSAIARRLQIARASVYSALVSRPTA